MRVVALEQDLLHPDAVTLVHPGLVFPLPESPVRTTTGLSETHRSNSSKQAAWAGERPARFAPGSTVALGEIMCALLRGVGRASDTVSEIETVADALGKPSG